MSLLSYARNGEDVVLYRALRHVGIGNYIDVGACDPEENSATKIFYDLGWSGVNVEPSRGHFESLMSKRKNDINLNTAVAAHSGILKLYDFPQIGLTSLVSKIASDARDRGFKAESVSVPVLTLKDICHELPFAATHFLRINVGGAERDVLLGADFTSFRPWIIVVETTAPSGPERVDGEWRGILETADYECVLFDGLNLYFLAREHYALRGRLAVPANVLDDYIPARLLGPQKAEREVIAAERDRIRELLEAERTRAESYREQRDRLDEQVRRMTEELLESRVSLRLARENFERELDGRRREGQLAVERHYNELTEVREQFAHFGALNEKLYQISGLADGGSNLEKRGAELLDLRAELLQQTGAWQGEVELLQNRLDAAKAQSDLMRASTSWRMTSPLRGLRRASHVLRREPRRLPGLIRQRANALLRRPGGSYPQGDAPTDDILLPASEGGTGALISVAARLDEEMALIADLLGSVSNVLGNRATDAAGPSYDEARLDEQLTGWILADVVRQRRAAL